MRSIQIHPCLTLPHLFIAYHQPPPFWTLYGHFMLLMMSWERARWLAWQGYGEVVILVLLCRRRSSCAGGGAVTLLRRRRSRYAGGGVVTHRSRAIEVLTHRVGVSIYLVNT